MRYRAANIERQHPVMPKESRSGRMETYLLIRVHGRKATRVTSLPALGRNIPHLFLGAVGEVSGVGVVGHFAWCGFVVVD
jgi:hypothetical protein